MGMQCFAQCITVSFSSLPSSLLSGIDLPHLASLVFGLRACQGESFGYTYGTNLNELNKNCELVMESAIPWKG